jgi:hypothetical protein
MRDIRFVAEHRGGTLSIVQHRQLIFWASACAEHVVPLLGENIEDRLVYALIIARKWGKGEASV